MFWMDNSHFLKGLLLAEFLFPRINFLGKVDHKSQEVPVNDITHERAHVVPDFSTISSKIREKALQEIGLMGSLTKQRDRNWGWGYREQSALSLHLLHPSFVAEWTISFLAKQNIRLGRCWKLSPFFHFTGMTLRPTGEKWSCQNLNL